MKEFAEIPQEKIIKFNKTHVYFKENNQTFIARRKFKRGLRKGGISMESRFPQKIRVNSIKELSK